MPDGSDQLPRIYKQAIIKYEQVTKKKLDDPALPKMASVDDLVKEIDRQNNKFSEFRETKHIFFDILEGAMKPIELVGDLAAGAASMAFPPSSLVFGAVSYLIGAAKGVSASYDAIQDLLASLKNFTVRLRIYNRETISPELTDQLSEILVTLIDVFALSRKAIKGGRFLKFARNVLIGSDDQIQEAVSKLAKLTETEHRLVGAETLTQAKRTGRVVEDISVTVATTNLMVTDTGKAVGKMSLGVTELNEKVDNLRIAIDERRNEATVDQERGHQDKAKTLLQPSVAAQDWYDKINKSRVPGTGDWVRDEEFFKLWIVKDIPILWISGNPGAGKSYLSSNIISFLRDQHPQGVQHPSRVSVGYFFFKDGNPKTRSFCQALRDVSYQISQNDPIYAKYLANSSWSHEDVKTLTSAWRNLFVNYFINKPGVDSSVYIVLDGVDEAFEEERSEFLELGKDIISSGTMRIQLAVVGRPHLSDSITEAIEREVPTIHVTDAKNSVDITRYVESSIHKSSILKRASKGLRSEIVSKLSAGAQGMFIWVDLMLKELLKKRSEASIRKSLDEAPKGLNEMLRHVLESFSSTLVEDEPDNLNELLAWVTCAERPLTLGELDTVLKLLSPEGDGMIYLEGVLRKQFASFFTLTREDRLTTADLLHLAQLTMDSDDDREQSDEEQSFKDLDNVTDFDSAPMTTEVTFCHASIGDFFRDEKEGKCSSGTDFPRIGVDFNEAKFKVLRTCLRLFCDEEFREKPQSYIQSLMPYAYVNWMAHLNALDPLKITVEQRGEIATLLAETLGKENSMKAWAGNLTWKSFNNDAVELFGKWLNDKEVQDTLPTDARQFAKRTAESPATIFKPVAIYIGKQWLDGQYWVAPNCCEIVYSYTHLEKGNPVDHLQPPSLKTADEMISVAEWLGFDKTALWHRRLAMALRDRSHYTEALEYFTKALELDSTMWIARAGIAVTHTLRGEYQLAIDLDRVNEKEVLEWCAKNEGKGSAAPITAGVHLIQQRMAKNHEALGDVENAFLCYKNARHNDPRCDTCTCKVLDMMTEKHLHGEIIDLLKAMQNETLPRQQNCPLTLFLFQTIMVDRYFNILADAARNTGELDFLLEAYRTAAREARKNLMSKTAIFLELCLAKLYYIYTREQGKALRIWNKIIATLTSARGERDITSAKLEASEQLARHALREALDAGIGSPESEDHVKTLEKLARVKGGSVTDGSSFIYPAVPSLVLGLWYRLSGRQEDANACFRPSIKEALDVLSDDDPDNDEQGYFSLNTILIAAGDFKNAIAILHCLGGSSEGMGGVNGEAEGEAGEDEAKDAEPGEEGAEASNDNDPGSDEDDDEEDDDDDDGFTCDGPCHRVFANYYTMHTCKYCFDVGFCQDCIGLLKGGEMPINVCSPKHDWLYIPPPSKVIESGKILVGDDMMDMEDWKKMMRKQWKI